MGPKRSQTESRSTPEVARPAAPGEGVLFSEAAQKAFVATEEIFREPHPGAPSPPSALVHDPLLSVEDFVVEQADPSHSGTVSPPGQATPAGPSTQLPSGSHRSAPIVLDDGK